MNLLLIINSRDTKYVQAISKPLYRFSRVDTCIANLATKTEVLIEAKKKRATLIATSSLKTMKLFDPFLEGTEAENVGYLYETDSLRIVLIPPLVNIWARNDGPFLLDHYLKKLRSPELFLTAPPFTWKDITNCPPKEYLPFAESCDLISFDIETGHQEVLCITSMSFTCFRRHDYAVRTFVIDFRGNPDDSLFLFSTARKLLSLEVPKVMQNGQYDCLYLLRFNSPVCNYLHDTYNLQHCLFPELKKELEFIALMYVRNVRFWKDESSSNLLEYNAKDTFYTLFAYLGQHSYIQQTDSQYALTNYQIEFPLIYPCLTCQVEGMLIDEEEQKRLRTLEVERRDTNQLSLETITGLPGINVNSPKQMKQLLHAMGYPEATKSDTKTLQKFSEKETIYERLATLIREIRGARKAISNYYDFTKLAGRLLFVLDPGGTETGRMASKSSSFWVGSQVQNQPLYCKSQYIPDEGYLFGARDYSQSESRCTAYISEDLALIQAVETSPDFHCANASRFFGIPFDQLYDADAGQVINKHIRTLSKRVNHGANYNMGPFVLWETMGSKNVFQAAHLLGLPKDWSPLQICAYLMMCFDKAYPKVRNDYYENVKHEIAMTGKLVGATGWTRRTFLRPEKTKPNLNSAVAHPPQSLSVMLVNQAFYKVWLYQMNTSSRKFRIKAQVHDEILWQYLPEYEKEVDDFVADAMDISISVNNRTLRIPTDSSLGAKNWKETK